MLECGLLAVFRQRRGRLVAALLLLAPASFDRIGLGEVVRAELV